jgi:GTP-binding protein HflX
LIASFRATLREAEEADLLLNVIDVSDDDFEMRMEEVDHVLREIGAGEVPQLLVFNKTDSASTTVMERVRKNYPGAVLISAKRGDHIDTLVDQIQRRLNAPRQYRLSVPQSRQKAIHYTHTRGRILKKEYDGDVVKMTVEMGTREIRHLEQFVVNES